MRHTYSYDEGQPKKLAQSTAKRSITGLLATTAACLGLSAAQAATPSDTLVMAYGIDNMLSLDPAQINEVVGMEIMQNVCDTLVTYDPADQSQLMPLIAESWEVGADGLSIDLKIRNGMTFSSGNPVTADDVAWSLQRVAKVGMTGATTMGQYGFTADNVDERITVVDADTVRLSFDEAYPPSLLLEALGASVMGIVLDRAVVEANAVDGDLGNKWLTTNTACTGPFTLVRWNPSDTILMEANPDYWAGAPGVRRILIRHIPEPGVQRLLLEQGDIDVARALNKEDIPELEARDDVRIETQLLPQMYLIYLNNTRPPFDNETARLAFRYLVDYKGLAETVMENLGVPRSSPIQLGVLGSLDEEEGLPFSLDIERARELLAEADFPADFTPTMLVSTAFIFGNSIAQSIQENARQAGVNINLEAAAGSQVVTQLRAHEYDMAMLGYRVNMSDPHGQAAVFLMNPDMEDTRYSALPSWRAGYFSQETNAQVQSALLETDPEVRAEKYRQLQLDMMQTGPYVNLFQLTSVMGLKESVTAMPGNSFRLYYNLIEKE